MNDPNMMAAMMVQMQNAMGGQGANLADKADRVRADRTFIEAWKILVDVDGSGLTAEERIAKVLPYFQTYFDKKWPV